MPVENIKLTDDEIKSILQADIPKCQSRQDELAKQREDYYKIFRSEPYGNERAGWSQSVAPVVWNTHQSVLSSISPIFSDEFFSIKTGDEAVSDRFSKLLRYQMFRLQDGEAKLDANLHNACLYHYSVLKVYKRDDSDLEYQTHKKLSAEEMLSVTQDPQNTVTRYTEAKEDDVLDPMTGVLTPGQTTYENVKVARKVSKFSGPYFEVIPPWEFFYSPDCKIGDWGSIDGRLVYHEVDRDLDYIRKKELAGVYRKGTYEACKELGSQSGVVTATDEREVKFQADELSEIDNQPDQNNPLARQLKVKECYVRMDVDKDGLLEPCIVTLIENQVVAQVEENPYKRPCFRVGRYHPEPHKIEGIALPSILENDQKIDTNLLRFMQDSAAQSIYRNPVTSDPRMQQVLQTRKPFDAILGDPNKVGEIKTSDPSQFILKAMEYNKGEREEKTGVTRYNQGMDAESLNKTATGISLISNSSNKRMRRTASLLCKGQIKGVILDFIFINKKFPSPPVDMSEYGITVDPTEFANSKFDLIIDIGVSPEEKNAVANQLDLLVQFGTQAGLNLGIMTPQQLAKTIKKKYTILGINVDELVTIPVPVQPMPGMGQPGMGPMPPQMPGGMNGQPAVPSGPSAGAGSGAGQIPGIPIPAGPGGGGIRPPMGRGGPILQAGAR